MPYIKQARQADLDGQSLSYLSPVTAGELNYCITMLCLNFLPGHTAAGVVTYEQLNAVVGALECAKLEFSRRMVAPYEAIKIEENGDVYPPAPEEKGNGLPGVDSGDWSEDGG